MRKFLSLIILLFVFKISSAQIVSSLRVKTISAKADTVKLDSVSIVPNSTFIITSENKIIDTSAYSIDAVNAFLQWRRNSSAYSEIKDDSIKIHFRVFPFLFSESIQHKDINKITLSGSGGYNPFSYNASESQAEIFKFQGLNKSGSISRGISFGNNQDVFVNSSLNLQLSGKLNDNVDILAAITDENIPIQPEGNTQQLQDFDKVFIQLSNDKNKLIAGDFELKRPDSYFMNFFKKGQGGYFTSMQNIGKKKTSINKTGISVAVSKGKFARNTLKSLEGNQGPYKLSGSNNETFIVVLAGTEKVYIDGQIMNRGLQNDYTIDYNTAEIIFTAKRLVTKDSRIVVEFEYSERSYARSLIYFNDEFEHDKLKIKFNVYSEQDSKSQPLQIELDSAKKALMSNVGDSINQAFFPTADSIAFNTNQILYAKIDTTTSSGTYFGIFYYTLDSDSAHYSVVFSNVGQGNGDYVQDINSANGRVYKWVEPLSGIHQGSYAPVVLLVTPKSQQLFTLATDYVFSKYNRATVEFGLSNNDINLFSKKDKSNDAGYAAKVFYENKIPFSRDTVKGFQLTSTLNYEYVNRDFKSIERYRNIEFERDWNLGTNSIYNDEHITSVQTALSKISLGNISYSLRSYLKGTQYSGLQHAASTNLQLKKFIVNGGGSYLTTKGLTTGTTYYKHNFDVAHPLWKLMAGVKENTEHNQFFKTNSDTLFANSFFFQEYSGFLSTRDSVKTHAMISYKQRFDYTPKINYFQLATFAEDITLSTEFTKNPDNQLRTTTTYRKLEVKDTTLTQQVPLKTLLNRIDYSVNFWKKIISSQTYYEVGTGQERKQEYYFLKVAVGQGSYIWNSNTDYNHDGLQQLNEFEIAAFASEGEYVKIFTPTNQYIATHTNQFNEVLNINPAAAYTSFAGTRPFITRFSNQLSVRLDKKTQGESLLSSLNPFNQKINDTLLVSTNSSFRNTFFFNRTSTVFGSDVTYQQNQSKSLLTNGFESRTLTSEEANVRWNITRAFLLTVSYIKGDKQNSSEFFSTRNYHLKSDETEQKFSFQPSVSFRTTISYKYALKKNVEGDIGEKTVSNKFGLEAKYSTVKAGTISARVNYIEINFNAEQNTSLAYEMLEGLRNGKNITWNATVQRNLGNSMQLNLNYDGRKSEGNDIIHTGGVQFRAFF